MAKKNQGQRKTYILDTNVFMADPECINMFDDNIVIIPDVVIEELDDNKKSTGDKGYNTRQALRNIDALRAKGSLFDGIETPNGGIVRIASSDLDCGLPGPWKEKPDNRILGIAKCLASESKEPVIIVSKDTAVRIKADSLGVSAEDYRHEKIPEDYLVYDGRREILLTSKDFDAFLDDKCVPAKKAKFNKGEKDKDIKENEFLLVRNRDTLGTVLGQMREGMIRSLRFDNSSPYGIKPKNVGQHFCIEALMAPASEIPLVILKGSAGTAKTFLTLACALQQVMERNEYRKITITRANVEFDKDIGSLPGDEASKVGPLLRGCMDNLELLVDSKGVKYGKDERSIRSKIDYILDAGYLSVESLGFLRGRSLTRQILFVDEAQNTSPSQMKGILTRAGEGTKLVLAGDLNQIDNPRLDKHNNGLAYALKLMSGDPLCCVVGFTDEETTRSKLAAKVAGLIS